MIIYCASLLSHKITKVPLFSRKKKISWKNSFTTMASHDDDRRRPPEEFQKLAKMTEKKWNVYRRPITLVLNVGLFVSTYSNYFTGKRMSWTFFFVKANQFNYFGINDMVDKWIFSEIGFFFSLRPFFIFYLGLNHFIKGMSVSHVTVCSSKDLWLIILWKSLEIWN